MVKLTSIVIDQFDIDHHFLLGITAIPADNYAIPIAYAIGSILVVLMLCLVCHRKLRRQSRGVPIDELPPQCVIDSRHCYHHHGLLHADHTLTSDFNQYQLEEPSPLNESDDMEELEQDDQQEIETSSPDSV